MTTRDEIPSPDAPIYQIGEQDRVTILGTPYRWISTDADGHVVAPERFPERRLGVLHSEFWVLVHGGSATVEENCYALPLNVSREPLERDSQDDDEQNTAFHGALCDALLQRVGDCGANEHFSETFLARLLPELASEVALLANKDQPCVLSHMPSPRQFSRLLQKHLSASKPIVLTMQQQTAPSHRQPPQRHAELRDGGCRIAAA